LEEKLLTFNGNIDKLKFSGSYDNLQFIFYLTKK
jgi:hypothetical protein